jgi:CBS domain-containing protein
MMHAAEVMAKDVVTVGPDTTVEELARLMINRHISGLPVVDKSGCVLGIVTEGDLLRRVEVHTDSHSKTWRDLFASNAGLATDYLKSHARKARDLMTAPVVGVTEDALLAEIADLMERRHIKRVPVLREGRLVGMISRIDLIRVLASGGAPDFATEMADRMIRDRLLTELHEQRWAEFNDANVIVTDGVVHLWGVVASATERAAMRVAAENVPGVRAVADHLTTGVSLI